MASKEETAQRAFEALARPRLEAAGYQDVDFQFGPPWNEPRYGIAVTRDGKAHAVLFGELTEKWLEEVERAFAEWFATAR